MLSKTLGRAPSRRSSRRTPTDHSAPLAEVGNLPCGRRGDPARVSASWVTRPEWPKVFDNPPTRHSSHNPRGSSGFVRRPALRAHFGGRGGVEVRVPCAVRGSGSPHEGGQQRAAAFWGRRPSRVEPRGSGTAARSSTATPTSGRRSSVTALRPPRAPGRARLHRHRFPGGAAEETRVFRRFRVLARRTHRPARETSRSNGTRGGSAGRPCLCRSFLAAGPAAPAAQRCPEPALGSLVSG